MAPPRRSRLVSESLGIGTHPLEISAEVPIPCPNARERTIELSGAAAVETQVFV
jgi:hypothetical protein